MDERANAFHLCLCFFWVNFTTDLDVAHVFVLDDVDFLEAGNVSEVIALECIDRGLIGHLGELDIFSHEI